jgi:hypothetical protein
MTRRGLSCCMSDQSGLSTCIGRRSAFMAEWSSLEATARRAARASGPLRRTIFTLLCEKETHSADLPDAVSCIFTSASTRCIMDASVAGRPVGTCDHGGKSSDAEDERSLSKLRDRPRSQSDTISEVLGGHLTLQESEHMHAHLAQSPKC